MSDRHSRNIAVIILTTALAGCAAGAITSPHSWEVGESIDLVQENHLYQWADPPVWFRGDAPPPDTNKVGGTTDLRLTSLGERTFRLQILNAQGVPVEYEPSGPSYEKIIGLDARLTLDSSGMIEQASGLEENEYVQAMGGLDVWMKEMQIYFVPDPEEPLREGLTWNRQATFMSHEVMADVVFDVEDTYTFLGESEFEGRPCHLVHVRSRQVSTSISVVRGDTIRVNLEGNPEGLYRLEPDGWQIISFDSSGRLDGQTIMGPIVLPTHWEQYLEIRRKW